MRSDNPVEQEPKSARPGRTLASFVILIHLFFVANAMIASYGRSETSARILSRFAFYTQLLNIDLNLNFAPYYLTHANEADVDHRIEVLPSDEETGQQRWMVLSRGRFRGGEGFRRYQRLGRYWGLLAADDENAARLARSIAEHTLRFRDVVPAQVRCRRHLLQDWEVVDGGTPEERDPESEVYFRIPYSANCIVHSDSVDVVKIEGASQVASPADTRTPSEGR